MMHYPKTGEQNQENESSTKYNGLEKEVPLGTMAYPQGGQGEGYLPLPTM